MYRMIYFSAAKETTNQDELSRILIHAREWNSNNNVTGILLHIDGDFLQILEGEKEILKPLFERIKNDDRHHRVLLVIEGKIEKRQFPNWAMGYKYTGYVEINKIDSLKSFDRNDFLTGDEKIANAFLKTFLETHKNQMNN